MHLLVSIHILQNSFLVGVDIGTQYVMIHKETDLKEILLFQYLKH